MQTFDNSNGQKKDIKNNFSADMLTQITYRPFDSRWTFYTGTSRGFQCRTCDNIMRHFVWGENIGLVSSKQSAQGEADDVMS